MLCNYRIEPDESTVLYATYKKVKYMRQSKPLYFNILVRSFM